MNGVRAVIKEQKEFVNPSSHVRAQRAPPMKQKMTTLHQAQNVLMH